MEPADAAAPAQAAPAWRLRREQWAVLACLTVIVCIAWAWLVREAARMSSAAAMASMPGMANMPGMTPPADAEGYFVAAFAMWAMMMTAMMLPSATPMILLYARIAKGLQSQGKVLVPSLLFAGLYLAVWSGFSLVAAAVQTLLVRGGVLSAVNLSLDDRRAAGVLLVAAGLYQATPLKRACLNACRSPLSFLTRMWRPTWAGAVRLGLAHGLYCVGCCWLVMALLFVGGVMSLVWVAALAVFVLAEKVLPMGPRIGVLTGGAAVLAGVGLIAGFPN